MSVADRDQIASGPDIPTTVHQRRGRECFFADPVDVKQLEFGAGAQHKRFTVIIGEEHFAVHRDG